MTRQRQLMHARAKGKATRTEKRKRAALRRALSTILALKASVEQAVL